MQKSISFKKASISFSDIGKGTAVVLLHGFLENTSMWKDVFRNFRNEIESLPLIYWAMENLIVWAMCIAWKLFAESVAAVLKHLRIRKCVVVGHSLGGYVALAFAEKYPQKIKGICLMNATSIEDDAERKTLRLRANKMIQKNFENMVRMSFTNLFGEKSRSLFKAEIKRALQEALKTPIQGYIAGQEGMRIRPNRTVVLIENNFKKLIIIGEKDPVLDLETSLNEAKKPTRKCLFFQKGI